MRIALLGPIGSGKGTQAAMLSKLFGIPTISPGLLYRKEIAEKTELGKLADIYVSKGRLVPDGVTVELLKKRLNKKDAQKGFVLDGFPRTLNQEKMFEKFFDIDIALLIELPDEEAIKRLSGRRSCVNGHVYHVDYNPPKKEGVCDIDGEYLTQRADDKPREIKERLRVFHKQVVPVAEYFRERGILRSVDGSRNIDEVSRAIKSLFPEKDEKSND